ncbi:DUF2683 family protein [Pedobacter faecalis]|uniref:DUF2683 family protein n=1 Tax=Pedobacter faecalis TaxID=3041495 RepID=UPI00254DEEAD|nr:DUF2683 family protein [Pedobacter sp. ELA7]
MATIVVHPQKDQLKAVKAILKALKVPFEETKGEKLPQHVLDGMKISDQQISAGRVKKFTTVEDLLGI